MIFAGFAAAHAAVLSILAATAWSTGRLTLRSLRVSANAPVSLALTVGLMTLAQASLVLGLFGLLRAPIIATGVVGAGLFAAWELRRNWQSGPPTSALALGAALTVLSLPGALLTLYPPLGFDQTIYHLPMARAFAASGGVPFLPALRYPIFPPLGEVLQAAILVLGDDVATQGAGWLAMVVSLGLAYTWARERSTAAGGWLAVGVLAGSPIAWYLASTGYVEPLLGLFGLGACYAADRARRDAGGGVGWLLVSAALAGSAAGVKYLGLYFVPAAAIVACAGPPWSTAARRALVFFVAAAAALAPSYGRLIAHTGNPLFPFYPELFGASPWAAQEFLGRRGADRLAAAATVLWDVVFRRARVGGLPPFSPAVALGLPLVVAALWRRQSLAILAGLTLGYVAIAPVHAHYLLAIVPVWAVAIGAAGGVLAGPGRGYTLALAGLTVALMTIGDGYAAERLRRLGRPPITADERTHLLTAQRPLYPAVQFLNRVAPGVPVYAVGAENMVDDRIGPLLGDHNGPVSHHRMEARVTTLGGVAAALDQIGAAYLLVREDGSVWTRWGPADPRLARVYADGHATVYRVSRAGPADRDSGAPPRRD